jgi:hypothetical protein
MTIDQTADNRLPVPAAYMRDFFISEIFLNNINKKSSRYVFCLQQVLPKLIEPAPGWFKRVTAGQRPAFPVHDF